MNKHLIREDIVVSTLQALRSYGSSWSSQLQHAAGKRPDFPAANARESSIDGTLCLNLEGEEVNALVGELEAIEKLVGSNAVFANCQIRVAILAWRRLAEENSTHWRRSTQLV
jgi:hypothetical protein